jgi:hypothetical protein
LPKKLDEEVARLHLDKLGVKLTKALQGPGRLHRCAGGGPVQERSLSVLSDAAVMNLRAPARGSLFLRIGAPMDIRAKEEARLPPVA